MSVRAAACGLLFVAVFAAPVRADDWPAAQVREVFSASRDWFVRVVPGESWGDTVGFAGEKKGRWATAEFYQRAPDRSYRLTAEAALRNPIAPVDVFVSNGGRLVTLDNWHNRGFGAVVAIYARDGSIVKSWALADLFSKAEIEAFPSSTSSIAWHDGPSYLREDQTTLYVGVQPGADLLIGIESGAFQYCEPKGDTYRCRDSSQDRVWRTRAEEPLTR